MEPKSFQTNLLVCAPGPLSGGQGVWAFAVPVLGILFPVRSVPPSLAVHSMHMSAEKQDSGDTEREGSCLCPAGCLAVLISLNPDQASQQGKAVNPLLIGIETEALKGMGSGPPASAWRIRTQTQTRGTPGATHTAV